MKKRLIGNLIWGIIMGTLMAALLGCDAVDKKATEAILSQLSGKYGKSFTVAALGNRVGRDTATAYVFADEDPTLRFTVRVNRNGELVFENYAYRTVCRGAEDLVTEAFARQNIEVVCFCRFSPLNNDVTPGISPEEYIETVHPESFGITLVIRDGENVTGENIAKAYETIHDQMGNMDTATGIYVLSAEDYDKVADRIVLETQPFDENRLRSYGVEGSIRKVVFQLTADGSTLTAEEITAALEKGGL